MIGLGWKTEKERERKKKDVYLYIKLGRKKKTTNREGASISHPPMHVMKKHMAPNATGTHADRPSGGKR